ncbi:MAG: VOC family protein [Rhizobiaceae bacterium]
MNTSPRKAHPLDHIVLPTASLDMARARLEALGFIVAPRGTHPFGTINECVYFADGTFLEPLAIGHRETAEAASLSGNPFTARDAAFRFRRGQEGLSAIAMGTDDAHADDKRFKSAGLSGGDVLDFGRDFVNPAGEAARMNFRLAFAADLRSPDFFGFTCQRINVPKADRSKLTAHANGVVSIRTVVLTEPNPTDFQYLLQELVNEREVEAHSFGMDIKASNATISVLNHDGYEMIYGTRLHGKERGLRARAVVFGVKDLTLLKAHLSTNGIQFREMMGRTLVEAAVGQGAVFAFEAVQ